MTGLMLGLCIIALFAYGDWLMARLDHSACHHSATPRRRAYLRRRSHGYDAARFKTVR